MVYEANTSILDTVLADVESSLEEANVPPKFVIPFLVAVEEIFVNIASYAYPQLNGEVKINLEVSNNQVMISFVDNGIPFNPLEKEDPDTNAAVEDRQIGGLGIYMVKKSMDGIEYERKDNNNILTFWKKY